MKMLFDNVTFAVSDIDYAVDFFIHKMGLKKDRVWDIPHIKTKLVEVKGDKVRRLGRHYVADSPAEKQSLAIEFCGIFMKALLEKVVRQEKQTYVRNHYLHIPDKKIKEFHKKLDHAVRKVVEEFATSEKDGEKFLNIFMTSNPF